MLAQTKVSAASPAGYPPGLPSPPAGKLAAAFAVIYLVWGSTYLAIRYAIETLPPFLMAGARFLLAGATLYVVARWRSPEAPAPRAANWRAAAVVGALLFLIGNGGLVWAVQRIPSGVAALLLATIPLWMVLLGWLGGSARPGPRVVSGLVMGFAGLALLVGPARLAGGGRVDPPAAFALVLAAICWAAGTILSRRVELPASPMMAAALQMTCGGALMILAGILTGEAARLDPAAVSLRSLLAFAYLFLFGSLLAFTAYIWLLGVVSPARLSTYAYVNPVVAMLLGWGLGGEPVSMRTAIAAAVIVAAVAMILTEKTAGARQPVPAIADA